MTPAAQSVSQPTIAEAEFDPGANTPEKLREQGQCEFKRLRTEGGGQRKGLGSDQRGKFVMPCVGCLRVRYRLVGLVVRRPPRERKIPGSNPACAGIFSGSSHTSDLKIGTPVATLPGAWRYRVSAGDWSARCQYTVTG